MSFRASRAGWALLLGASWCASAAAEPAQSLGPEVLRSAVQAQRAVQGILTPIPIGVELPLALPARRVLAHYQIFGSNTWKALELRRSGSRWLGAIPCLEVSTITGDVKFYIRVYAADGSVTAYSGSRHQPYRVKIVYQPTGAAEPQRCPDPADCPPGLPGCPSAEVERVPCSGDDDCEGQAWCGWDGFCEDIRRPKNWLRAEVEAGVGLVPVAGACSIAAQERDGFACYRERDGALYLGHPVYTRETLATGVTQPRAVLSYERALFRNTSVAARLGYALWGTGPEPPSGTPFVPFSAELRVARYLSEDAFSGTGIRPYVFLGTGYSMFDIELAVHVREDPTRGALQPDNDLEQTLTVWKRAGDAYVAGGGGVVLRLTPGFGVLAEASGRQVFPYSATIVSGSLGVTGGF